MLIIGVDPGGMCGMLQYDDVDVVKYQVEFHPFRLISLLDMMDDPHTDVLLAVEKFIITPQTHKMTRQYDALETIGALRYVATKRAWGFELQPRGVKEKVDNATLKRLGWYQSTKDGHANDAARHAFIALCKHRPNDDLVRRGLGMIV